MYKALGLNPNTAKNKNKHNYSIYFTEPPGGSKPMQMFLMKVLFTG
jgi:hypothetical protein